MQLARLVPSLVLAATLAAPATALAASAGLPVEPGFWELSYSIPDPLGGSPIEQRRRTCVREKVITAERVNAEMRQCRITNAVIKDTSAKWKMRCDTQAGSMTGIGTLRSNGVSVSGSMEMSMSVGQFQVPISGAFKARRLGPCR